MIDVGTCLMLLKDDDIDACYTCTRHKERNIIATTIFSTHVDETYPIVKPGENDQSACDGIPRHTIIIESSIESKEEVMSEAFHNYVIDNHRYADVKQGTSRHIDPSLNSIQVFH